MQFLASLLTNLAYLNPISIAGWLVWFGLAGVLIYFLLSWRTFNHASNPRAWGIFLALLLATPIAVLFLGLEFPTGSALPIPGLPEEPPGSTLMIFSAVPWTLAGGLLGPFAAAAGGMLGGVIRSIRSGEHTSE